MFKPQVSYLVCEERGLVRDPAWGLAIKAVLRLVDPVRQNNVVSTLCDGPRPPLSQSLAFDPMIQSHVS
jgi:hypothetical protein